jgi:hypothetical protein
MSRSLATMIAEELILAPGHVWNDFRGSINVAHAVQTSNSIVARIHWCRKQQMSARTKLELEEWCAEEDGLTDALHHRNRTFLFQCSPAVVLQRYVMGLEDGGTLIRTARVESVWQPTI